MSRLKRIIQNIATHPADKILEGIGEHLPENQYFTDDAMTNAYFTNDAVTNNYTTMDA